MYTLGIDLGGVVCQKGVVNKALDSGLQGPNAVRKFSAKVWKFLKIVIKFSPLNMYLSW